MAWGNTERTALLIDGTNCYEATKRTRYSIDYAKVLKLFNPRQAYYLMALPENNPDQPDSIFKLIDFLDFNGYTIISKRMKTFNNAGVITNKGNMDVEIAVHMLKASEWATHIVLFTGDGDFRIAVEAVQQKGIRVTVVSTTQGHAMHSPMVADELRRQANVFIDMCDPEFRDRVEWRG